VTREFEDVTAGDRLFHTLTAPTGKVSYQFINVAFEAALSMLPLNKRCDFCGSG